MGAVVGAFESAIEQRPGILRHLAGDDFVARQVRGDVLGRGGDLGAVGVPDLRQVGEQLPPVGRR